ncbi:NAD-dependent epimerase/dehydratase family protein [Candidatus Uhrbacteria bacterium]|nr:NAD-dependent epimerase/dehydratase family protein [Candidatus Uhrbacteria bacterium]
MAKYLVTGGAGFIGSNLVDKLIEAGHEVRVLDIFVTGKRENLNPKAQLFELDFTDLEAIRPAFEGVDGVFHLGARPSVPYSVEHPVESTQTNIMGTLNVLMAARDAKVKRVVYSASSSAYGIQPQLPQHPDMTPNPQSPYAIQKYVGELYCKQFAKLYGLETVCLRYFNIYGPRMNDVGAYVPVFTFFLRQVRAGEPLTVFGDGEQSRDFTHVSDAVAANIAAMQSGKVGNGETLNVGAGGNTTINDIVKMFGKPAVHLEPRAGDVPRSQADISRTKELLDWEPKIHFRDGLAAWLRSQGIDPVL